MDELDRIRRSQHELRSGQALVGESEARVDLHRLLVEANGGLPTLGGSLRLLVASAHVRVGRLGVYRRHHRQPCLVCRRDLGPDLPGDVFRDLPLQRDDVLQLALVALRPEVRVAGPVDELYGDPDAIAVAQHRPFDDGFHVQLAGDLRNRLIRIGVAPYRSARDHAQRLDLAQLVDHSFQHAGGEVVLLTAFRREVL